MIPVKELDKRIAEEIMGEPEPTVFPDWEMAFHGTLNGYDLVYSPDHCWQCLTLYENGDEMKWYPVAFHSDMNYAMRVITQMEDEDVDFTASNVIPSSDAIVYEVRFTGHDKKSGYACEDDLATAICMAALDYKSKQNSRRGG